MHRYSVGMADQVGGYNKLTHTPLLFEPGAFPGGPNRDTLYSYGWFDLDDGPYVVSLPSFGDRYFVWQMTDVYEHNFGLVSLSPFMFDTAMSLQPSS